MSIRILHTIDTTGPGGAETVFVNLIKGLDRQQFEPIVAIKGPGWVCDTLQKNGIKPITIPSEGGYNYKYIRSLIRIIKDNNIDVVQSHLLGSNVYCSLAGLICKVPVISTFHGFVDTSGNEKLIKLKKNIINVGSKKIVFVSNKLRDAYVKRHTRLLKKTITIYNGIDTKVFCQNKNMDIRKQLSVLPGDILIGAIGNIRPAKGYEYFLKAAKIVNEMNPKCKFIIVGNSDSSGTLYCSLKKLQKELGLESIFTFMGFQSDISKVINNMDIFVLPSTSEGFSIATVEALACKIPVVVTRSGGPEEILTNSTFSRIVEPHNENDLASGIISIVKKIENEKIINFVWPFCLEEYTLKKMVEKYSVIYESCVKENR